MRTGEPNIANDEGNFKLHNSEVSLKHAEVFVEILLISSAVIKYI